MAKWLCSTSGRQGKVFGTIIIFAIPFCLWIYKQKKKKRLLNRFLWRFLKLSVRRNEEWCAILWLPHPAGNSLSDRKSTYRLNNQQWSSSSAILFVCHASSLLFRGRLLVWSPQCPLISFMSELSLMLILEALLCV